MEPAQTSLPIDGSYNVLRLTVVSSTHITAKVSAILDHFSAPPDAAKPVLVCLIGKPGVSNKVISIAEIAKRELSSKHSPVHQYTQLTSVQTTVKSRPGIGSNQDDGTFETMRASDKIYDAPVLSVYLCSSSVPGLKKQLGEQIHAQEHQ